MGEFSHYAMQAALYELLVADTALMNSISGVYDHVPPNTAYPYVTIGDMRATDISAVNAPMTRLEMVLHVYSRERGRKETSDIMAQLYTLLHDSNPVITDYKVINLHYVSSDIAQERDGLTYQGKMHFSAVLQAIG